MVLENTNRAALIVILTIFFMLITLAGKGQLSAKVEKRLQKALNESWPDVEILRQPIEIPQDVSKSFHLEETDQLFSLYTAEEWKGILLMTSSKGRFEYFDYMVMYDTQMEIIAIEILVYRSDHGHEIMNKGWLKSFSGYPGCDLEYGKEIDAITGATFSANSLTEDIRRWCGILLLLDSENIIRPF